MKYTLRFVLCCLLLPAAQLKAQTDLPVLFAKQATFDDFKISPDGQHLAAVVYSEGKRSLIFFDAKTMKAVGSAKAGNMQEVGDYRWVSDERVVIKLVESSPWLKKPQYFGELLAVNYDGSKAMLLFGYRAGEQSLGSNIKKKQSMQAWAEFVNTRANDKNRIVISATPMSSGGDRLASIMQLDVYNGKTKGVGKAPVSYARIVADPSGRPRVAVGTNAQNQREVYIKDEENSDWHQLPQRAFGSHFYPIAVTADNQGLYVADNYQQDLIGIFEYRFADGSYTEVFTDKKVDVSGVTTTTDGHAVYGMQLDDGRPSYALLTEDHQEARVFKDLLQSFPGENLKITSKTDDDKKWVLVASSDVTAPRFYLYDHEKGTVAKLADTKPELNQLKLASTEPVKFSSFDGLEVHGYLTKSPVASAEKPTVVLVHGGPHNVRDYWGFDPEVQLLAMSGYNVLQVNFRGSGGYGAAFQQKGYRQWGDAIQRDIIAGTEWAIAQGHAKAGNVCIMGTSFGGYSTVQAATLAPDLYRCGVAVAGVYDLSLLAKTGDLPDLSFGAAYLQDVIGKDEAQLKAFSPVHQVNKLKASLLIAHGKKDKRAPVEHAERLKNALDKAGKSYQWLEFNDEAHGFYAPQNQEIYFRAVQKFLAEHLKS